MRRRKISCILIIAMLLSAFAGFQPNPGEVPVAQAAVDENHVQMIGEWETIYFGRYWQSDTNGDGIADKNDVKEPIRWRVLTRSGDYALLLADKILDAGKYYTGGGVASWEKSDVRNWLNTTFYREAFSGAEGDAIAVRTLTTTGGEESWGIATNLTKEVTKDKVYLLSYDEICQNTYGFPALSYNNQTDIRTAATTGYAATRPGMYAEAGSGDAWWLRNAGFTDGNIYTGDNAYNVGTEGLIDPFNMPANVISGIRPAIYVNLSGISLWTAGDNVIAEELPAGKNINGSMTDSAGNLPIASRLPDWAGGTVSEPGGKETDAPATETPISSQTPSNNGAAAPSKTAKPSQSTTSTTTSRYRITGGSATVYPAKVSGVKAKNSSKKTMKVTWKKANRAEYYEIQIAKNRGFTKGKKRTTSYSRSTYFWSLKKKTTYYVRVRAVRYSNGANRYGRWSAVKKVKIKK